MRCGPGNAFTESDEVDPERAQSRSCDLVALFRQAKKEMPWSDLRLCERPGDFFGSPNDSAPSRGEALIHQVAIVAIAGACFKI